MLAMNILGTAATVFTTKADLRAAVQAYANPTAAIATYGAIAGLDVSAITDMSALFYEQAFNNDSTNATATFGPIETWDVSGITNMSGLFSGLEGFNGNISSWDTSAVTDMSRMFEARSDASLKPLHHTLTPARALWIAAAGGDGAVRLWRSNDLAPFDAGCWRHRAIHTI